MMDLHMCLSLFAYSQDGSKHILSKKTWLWKEQKLLLSYILNQRIFNQTLQWLR